MLLFCCFGVCYSVVVAVVVDESCVTVLIAPLSEVAIDEAVAVADWLLRVAVWIGGTMALFLGGLRILAWLLALCLGEDEDFRRLIFFTTCLLFCASE